MTVTVRPYKRGGWEVDIVLTFPGRPKIRERKKCPLPTKAAAKQWGELRERQLIQHHTHTDPDAEGKIDNPDVSTKEVPTLAAFIPRYIEGFCKANRHRPSTIIQKESNARLHLVPTLGHRRLDRITAEDVQKLKAALGHLKPSTANTAIKLLKAILHVAVEWKVIPELPTKISKIKESETELDFYGFDDYARLVAVARKLDPRVLLVVLLGGHAGLRRGEIIALEWSDIDLAHGRMTVARSEYRGHLTSTKGHRSRTIPLSDDLRRALEQHRIGGPRVLYTASRAAASASSIDAWLAAAQQAAGFPIKGPHILRHTFCSHLAMKGAPARAIQKLAGHQSVVTTERYMHLSPVVLEESIRLLSRRPAWRHDGDGDSSPLNIQ